MKRSAFLQGNSFVHETESQVILNGSRDINFTMDLVSKDVGLFDKIAHEANVPVELSPLDCQNLQGRRSGLWFARVFAEHHPPL